MQDDVLSVCGKEGRQGRASDLAREYNPRKLLDCSCGEESVGGRSMIILFCNIILFLYWHQTCVLSLLTYWTIAVTKSEEHLLHVVRETLIKRGKLAWHWNASQQSESLGEVQEYRPAGEGEGNLVFS